VKQNRRPGGSRVAPVFVWNAARGETICKGVPLLYCIGAASGSLPSPGGGEGEAMADEDLQAQIERLKAENEALKQKRSSAVSMKVSEKGAVSVYGLGRFPVTLYQEQWQKLLALSEDIKSFIDENRSRLKVKE
jgi:hypothetical protein